MPLNWLDVTPISFNALLLFERAQLNWLPGWHFPPRALAIALAANPAVAWYLCHKAPEIAGWVDSVLAQPDAHTVHTPAEVREAELAVLRTLEDLLVYALDPAVYDAQPFLGWDSAELTGLTDFTGKVVLDIGAGTGRQTFTVAPLAAAVFAVEPVGNLRDYLRAKARRLGLTNVYPVDGLITRIPFPDGFADVVMSGHVYGDEPEAEVAEVMRVTRPGGMAIFIPGNNDIDNESHRYLVGQGFAWAAFEEPRDGMKRKYWKRA
jgi:SAM-dependent methyltransferase